MKLATYRDGSRDGQLVVVSRDLSTAHYATGIANHLQQVLDDWNFLSPLLHDLTQTLNHGKARHAFPFDPSMCLAPLPRAHLWAQVPAYPNHQALTSEAAGVREPLQLRWGPSDDFRGAHDPLLCADEAWDMDIEAGWAVVTGDIARAASPEQALEGVRLLMLSADAVLRQGAAHGQPCLASTFSPVAVTPDELGDAWTAGRLHLALQCTLNGRRLGLCDAGPEMSPAWGQILSALAQLRRVRAGAVVGTGPVSNAGVGSKGSMVWPKGCSTLLEKRAIEVQQAGAAVTPYLKQGDTFRIEMKGRDGLSIFGAIESTIVSATEAAFPAP